MSISPLRKIIVFFLAAGIGMYPAFCLEFQAIGHFDNYRGNKAGISVFLSERLGGIWRINADVKYENGGQYTAACTAEAQGSVVSAESGIIYRIKPADVLPGMLLRCDLNIFPAFALTSKLIIGGSPDNLKTIKLLDIESGFIVNSKNSRTKIAYNYCRETENSSVYSRNKIIFDVLCFDSATPFRMGLTAVFSHRQEQNRRQDFDITLETGTKIEYLASGKKRLYFIQAGTLISTNKYTEYPLSFSCGAGVKFFIE
ncbi:MAG: hypothetical protein NC041_09525 [Bacteroides sp.]|nr:hypothetical protein [Prevotella sp.]MCM1408775.1 hypothetical protein [Treponema brennaborense]MCM1470690.1 hypothetical protein [Bacteroides sp.]